MDCSKFIVADQHHGINLRRISDNVCGCEYGYFINRKNNEWVFTALEKDMNVNILMVIANTLRNLNELRTLC